MELSCLHPSAHRHKNFSLLLKIKNADFQNPFKMVLVSPYLNLFLDLANCSGYFDLITVKIWGKYPDFKF